MTIVLHWHHWVIAFLLMGVGGAFFLSPKEQGYLDFLPTIISLAWLIGGCAMALGVVVGHFF